MSMNVQVERFLVVQTRRASTYVGHLHNSYPFPCNSRPTPHQIFHLPPDASQKDIKSRYYDLVRIHHPDSPHCRHVAPALRHAQFQSITQAYEVLNGKRHGMEYESSDPLLEELERRRRTLAMRNGFAGVSPLESGLGRGSGGRRGSTSTDDGWRNRMVVCVGILALGIGLFPNLLWTTTAYEQVHLTASANLAQARKEAREFGDERRREIRRRLIEHQAQMAAERLRNDEESTSEQENN